MKIWFKQFLVMNIFAATALPLLGCGRENSTDSNFKDECSAVAERYRPVQNRIDLIGACESWYSGIDGARGRIKEDERDPA